MKNSNDIKNTAHKRRNKKLLLLFLVFGITILSCVYTTYAWFIGTGFVKVNNFTINLTTENYLEISLDGYTWTENLTITENTIKSHSDGGGSYVGNKNSWVGESGLVPVSSSGTNTEGRLDIYSKSSLIGSDGGYRIVADKIDNSLNEANHYVSFDIFVKNKSGDIYNNEYNLLDDENIFLTNDSTIIGTANGATSYGVQNSARVAFVQIGRINLDDLVANTTPNILCEDGSLADSYTKLCNVNGNVYNTVIWEPNELDHDSKLVSYYNLVCKSRTTRLVYGTRSCTNISSGYVPTYTVANDITSDNKVDIYDGLNGYNNNIKLNNNDVDNSLKLTKTFTDSMKETEGYYTLFKLHPHSVTKIKVYVYLEGQDVDNYDLITNDLNIQVNFGFTKERKNTDILLDEEPTAIEFKVNGQNYRAFVDNNKVDTYTWGDLITDNITSSDSNKVCFGEFCQCLIGGYIFLRNGITIGDYYYYGEVFDSNNDNITSTTIFTTGDYHTNSVSNDTHIGFGSVCTNRVSTATTFYLDENTLTFGVRLSGTWSSYPIGWTITDNDFKCNNYFCINKVDGRVVSKSSYDNGYGYVDFIIDENGHIAEKDDRPISWMHYTTYHPPGYDSSSSLLSFTVDDYEYYYYEGMNWFQWLNSEYNTSGFGIWRDADNEAFYIGEYLRGGNYYEVNDYSILDTSFNVFGEGARITALFEIDPDDLEYGGGLVSSLDITTYIVGCTSIL